MLKTPFIHKISKKRYIFLYASVFISAVFISSYLGSFKIMLTKNRDIIDGILNMGIPFSPKNFSLYPSMPLFNTVSAKSQHHEPKKNNDTISKAEQKHSVPDAKLISASVTKPSQEIKITNLSGINPDIEKLTQKSPEFLNEKCSVLILHTHTTESYTPTEKNNYTPSENDRTTDGGFNMIRVGNEICNILSENGFKVYHDTSVNDYPSYNGSYNRSCKIAQNYLEKDPSIKIILDIHRDAVETKNGTKLKHISKIEGNDAASVMLVVGSETSGLPHENWETNMSFALSLQKYGENLYPGLFRPLNFRKQRFNQHLAPGAIIAEIGTNGNTLEEALLGANYFAKALSSFLTNH